MNVIVVRTQAQLQLCLQLRKEVFVDEQQVPEQLEIDELDHLEANCQHLLLLDVDSQPVAAARLKPYDPVTSKIQRVAVKQTRRGEGLGKYVMLAAEQLAKQKGCQYTLLDAQLQAQPFYEKLGYEVVSKEPFLDADIWHVRMRKEL